MELYQLGYFVEVAEQRNFTRAAERLHLAQPALSQQVKNLESEFGTPLFIRSRRETVLTQAGEVLLIKARALLADAAIAKQAVADVANLKRGKLILAAIPSISGRWLPAYVRKFRQAHPQVELVLQEGSSDEVSKTIDSGRAELGFLQFPTDERKFRSGQILSESFVAVIPPRHRLAIRSSVSLSQLAEEPFVFYKGRAREVVLAACREAGFEPAVACESGELETVRSLVAADLGIAVLPELGAWSPGEGAEVRPLKKPRLIRKLGWIARKGSELSSAAAAFVETFARATKKTV
jgi:LysR family transcriptional regulator, hydrogen peroxide-inducible genes activator